MQCERASMARVRSSLDCRLLQQARIFLENLLGFSVSLLGFSVSLRTTLVMHRGPDLQRLATLYRVNQTLLTVKQLLGGTHRGSELSTIAPKTKRRMALTNARAFLSITG